MSKATLDAKKGIFEATVCSNEQTGRCFYQLGLQFEKDGAKAFATARPGQFAQIDVTTASMPDEKNIPPHLLDASRRSVLLRRPFTFCDISTKNETTFVDILYEVVGPASLRMTTLKQSDSLSVIGPLGNGFWKVEGKKTALLVAGGMGTPPLQHMANFISKNHPEVKMVALIGARSKEDLPIGLKKFARYKVEGLVATDDGSIGMSGFVTVHLKQWLEEQKDLANDSVIIYSCGPEPMLAKVAKIAGEYNIDCQVSVERRMACGIGLCQSCAVECGGNGADTIYKMCCQDGPVFDSREIIF